MSVVCTDAFLLPNAVLAERGITMRKGFPDSFDDRALVEALSAIRSGAGRVDVPVYSHLVYDIVPGEAVTVQDADLVIVEGVNALQEPVAALLDVAIYIHAAEEVVRSWYVDRFLELTGEARRGAESFYRAFASMPDERIRGIAETTWDTINAVNLRDHIGPSRARATIVVEKSPDHAIRLLVTGG